MTEKEKMVWVQKMDDSGGENEKKQARELRMAKYSPPLVWDWEIDRNNKEKK